MSGPQVSIIIDNYNYARFLARAIGSALTQTWSRTEVIVVDDASTDGSREVIESFGEKVRLVQQTENRGQGAAFNAGFAASKGDIVLFLDADDELYPGAVDEIVRKFGPGVAKVQFRLDLVDGEGRRHGAIPAADVRFEDGDVLPHLLRRGRYATNVTTGNAFSRETLERILPVPEGDFHLAADGYLVATAPFHGRVASIEATLGVYRTHGKNAWAGADEDLAGRARRAIAHDALRHAAIRAEAARHGLIADGDLGLRDTDHLASRLTSLALDPGQHPVAGDTRGRLGWLGARASLDDSRTVPSRAVLAVWFLSVGWSPSSFAAAAVRWRLSPESRPESLQPLFRAVRGILRPGGRPPTPRQPTEAVLAASQNGGVPSSAHASRARVARNALHLVGGQVATTVLAILLSAALGRFLGAKDFGLYFLITTMATFAYVVVEGGQQLYVIREVARDPARAGILLGSSLVLRVAGAVAVVVPTVTVAWAMGYDPSTRRLAAACVAAMLPFFLAQGFGMVFRSRDAMGLDAMVSVSNKILVLSLAVPVLLAGFGVPGVLAAQALAGLGALGAAAWFYRRLRAPPLRLERQACAEVIRGGAPILAMNIATSVQPYIDVVLLTKFVPDVGVGWFGAARNVMGTLIAPSMILASASYPSLSRAAGDPAALRASLRGALRPLLWLGGLGAVGTYQFAGMAIGLIYGSRGYGPAADILRAFAPALFLLFVDVLLGHALTAFGKARAFAMAKAASILVSTGLSLVLVPTIQARTGNGGVGLVLAFGISELVVFVAATFLMPRGSLDPALLGDGARAVLAAVATLFLLQILPPLSPIVGIPLCIAAFTLASMAVGLVTRADLALVRTLARRAQPSGEGKVGP